MFTEFIADYDPVISEIIEYRPFKPKPRIIPIVPTIQQYPFPIFQSEDAIEEVDNQIDEQVDEQEVKPLLTESLLVVKPLQTKASSIIDSVVNLAKSLVGGKYKYGGIDPKIGLDCSGLVYYVYGQNGIKIPRTTKSTLQSNKGIKIDSLKDVKKGDAIITPGGGENKMHDLIAVEDYNPKTGTVKVVSASNPKKGIVYRDIGPKTKILGIRRFVETAKNGGVLIPKCKYLF